MPMMGNTMETGLVAEWVAGEGDEVEEDGVIAIVSLKRRRLMWSLAKPVHWPASMSRRVRKYRQER